MELSWFLSFRGNLSLSRNSNKKIKSLRVCIHRYTCICTCICVCIHVYIGTIRWWSDQ